jgi:hypothetical protein
MKVPRTRVLVGLAMVFVLALYWLIARLSGGAPVYPPLLSVRVVGYTNMPDGQVLAQVAISNSSQAMAMFWDPVVQLQTNGAWFTNKEVGKLNVPLSPRQFVVTTVPKPPDAGHWRVMVVHLRPTGALESKARNVVGAGKLPRRFAVTEDFGQ